MIFTKEHVEKIREGEKTVTRRIWKKPHVKVGGIYGVRSDRFKPVAEDAPRIKIVDMRTEKLREITEHEAILEGCKTKSEFFNIWLKLHGSWNPEQEVYRIQFELVHPEED